MYNLRLAQLDELKYLSDLDNKSNLTPWSYNHYYNSYLNDNNFIYVFELKQNQEIYACCVLAKLIDELEILQLWVNINYQGLGIGGIFLKEIIQLFCKESCIERIFLELRENNLLAQKFYVNNGFKIIGKRKRYYKVDNIYIDAILMMNNLKEFMGV